jgi:hypothetical protein
VGEWARHRGVSSGKLMPAPASTREDAVLRKRSNVAYEALPRLIEC